LAAARSEITRLTGRLDEADRQRALERQQANDARIAQLPPAQRQDEQIKALQEEVRRLSGSPPVGAPPAFDPVAYQKQLSEQMIAQYNSAHGLEGDEAITGDEDDLDWRTPETFEVSLGIIAKQRQRSASARGGGDMAAKKPETVDLAALTKQVRDQVLQEMGAGNSNSPRPNGGTGSVSQEDIRKTVQSGSIVERRKAAREMRDRAAVGVPRG
jgi:hypothetical protein